MKILFVANEVPYPPDNGVRIVSHHAMRLMHEAGHQLALAVLTEERDDVDGRLAEAAKFCGKDMAWCTNLPLRSRIAVQVRATLDGRPFFVERYRYSGFRQKLANIVAALNPDVVHLDTISLVQYWDVAPRGAGVVASINDSNALTLENALADGVYGGWERVYRRFQYSQVCRYESDTYSRCDAVHVMSSVDAEYLLRLNPALNVAVISNGVEPALFSIADRPCKSTDIIFVATLRGENILNLRRFLEISWPIVRREFPLVKLHVVGKIGDEAESLRKCSKADGSVMFRGYVKNLADAYTECGIAIAPVNKNCGIINKVIEAMAAGLAVVGFEKSFAGIPEGHSGQHFVTASDYVGFGRCVAELIRNDSRRSAIQSAAHQLATEFYSWSTRREAYEEMYQAAAKNAKCTVPAPRPDAKVAP